MTSSYDVYPAVLHAIELIRQGETRTQACLKSNIPVSTLQTCAEKNRDVAAMIQEAEQLGHDAMADALVNIDNDIKHGTTDPKLAKIKSDNIKWFLSKKNPKNFGDRVVVEHNVTMDVAITARLDAARSRSGELIEGAYTDVTACEDEKALLHRILGLPGPR